MGVKSTAKTDIADLVMTQKIFVNLYVDHSFFISRSEKTLQLAAQAYTKGNHGYLGPKQEKYLGHELGHVIHQKQGRVKPTGMLYVRLPDLLNELAVAHGVINYKRLLKQNKYKRSTA